MRVGLIARAEDRGLGVQTWEWSRGMRPDETLIVDMGELGGGHADAIVGATKKLQSTWRRRLKSLRDRRMGTDRIAELTFDSAVEVMAKSRVQEAYLKRAPIQKYTQYALGAMQAVDPDYTRISLEEADRVKDQLKKGFDRKLISTEFRLQGSVACDIHIRGVSDVDLLVLDGRYIH